jgi:hypothetical protein
MRWRPTHPGLELNAESIAVMKSRYKNKGKPTKRRRSSTGADLHSAWLRQKPK